MATKTITLNRGRFILFAVTGLVATIVFVVIGTAGWRDEGASPNLLDALILVAAIAELAMTWFYLRIARDPEIEVGDWELSLPWKLHPRDRSAPWRDFIAAEIAPTKFALSGQPVLRLVGKSKSKDLEIPRSFVRDWDALIAEARRRLGPIENRYDVPR